MKAYMSRAIKFKGVKAVNDWKIKVYSIIYDENSFSEALENESIHLLHRVLTDINSDTYGLGFLIVHHGKDSNFVLFDWWCNENELQHLVYYSSKINPGILKKQSIGASIACVWDLQVINHERNAWVKHMMRKNPDRAGYLKSYINGDY